MIPEIKELQDNHLIQLRSRVDELVSFHLERSVRAHLDEIIRTAKDEAVKQIAAKLLKCALEG